MESLVGLSEGLNKGIEGKGASYVKTIADYASKNKELALQREKLYEDARQFNEKLAYDTTNAQYANNQIAEQTQKLMLQNDEMKIKINEMEKQTNQRNLALAVLGYAETGNATHLSNFIRNNEALNAVLGEVKSLNDYNVNFLKERVTNQDLLNEALANPRKYVISEKDGKINILDIQSLAAAGGAYTHYNQAQLENFQQLLATKQTEGVLNELSENPTMENVSKSIQAIGGKFETPLNFGDSSFKNLHSIITSGKKLNDTEKSALTSNIKQSIIQSRRDLDEKTGKPVFFNQVFEEISKNPELARYFNTAYNFLKENDKTYQTKYVKSTDAKHLLNVVNHEGLALLDNLEESVKNKLDKNKINDVGYVTEFLRNNAPKLLPAWLKINSFLGDNKLASEKDYNNLVKEASLYQNFISSYGKYISGVAIRKDELERIQDVFGSIGDDRRAKLTKLKKFMEQQLDVVDQEKALDPQSHEIWGKDTEIKLNTAIKRIEFLEKLADVDFKKLSDQEKEEYVRQFNNLHSSERVKKQEVSEVRGQAKQTEQPTKPVNNSGFKLNIFPNKTQNQNQRQTADNILGAKL